MAGVLAFSLCPGFGVAYAEPTAAEKQAEAEAALSNLNAMQETLDRLSAEYGEALAAQEEAEANRDAAEAKLDELNGQISDLQDRLGERAREMYRSGSIPFVEILLGARSFEEFATSWDMLNKVNENDAEMVETRKVLAEQANEQAQIYNDQALVAAQKSQEAADAARQAESTVAEMQATYDSLSEEAARLLEEERAAQAAAEAARAAAIVAESAANAGNGGNGGGNDGGAGNADSPVAPDNGGDNGSTEDTPTYDPEQDAEPVAPSYEGGSDTVSRAYACLGAPYVWGGVGPDGYDCSGLVSYCLSGSHTRLGTTYTFMNWPQVSDPQPGDICVNSGHTGIYIGGGQMIHAATYGVGVIIGPVQSGMIIVRWQG
ncbi:MAG: C40 family peptidase [Eggerthellaceae bacterium]|nr:C40 family peptidase [Eggerthellaceae bacterium]